MTPEELEERMRTPDAEEVAEIQGLEDIVEYNEDGNPENISYNSLAPILISVVKRVLSRLDALEAK